MRAQLFRVYCPEGGRKRIIEKGLTLGPENIIGRSKSSYVQIDSSHVSERQAQIFRRKDGLFEILDLREPNGTNVTLVNGKKVVRRILLPGDEISFPGCEERLKFTTRSERVAVLMNDGTEEHACRLARFAAQLEKRGVTVILLTPALEAKCEGLGLNWKSLMRMENTIFGPEFHSESDSRPIGDWLEPFVSKYNMIMDYLLVLVSRSRVDGDIDVLPQVAEIVSRVQVTEKIFLSRGLSDSPSLKWIPVYVTEQEIDGLTRRMGSIFQRFGRRKYDEFEIPDREGEKLILPARQDKFF